MRSGCGTWKRISHGKYAFVGYLFLLLNLHTSAVGQTFFSGEITQNTRWQGMVYIDGDVTVPSGVILSISEGTRIHFKPKSDRQKSGKDKERAELIVNGVLIARSANPEKPIVFTSLAQNPQMNDWYGITIKNFYNQSQLVNCVIEFGYKGITCYGSSPLISGGEIRFNHNSGISCEVKSSPVIENVVILGNGFAGINCELASSPVVSGCTITENTFGIVILSRSAPDLGTLPPEASRSRGENRITNNFDYDIYNHSAETIRAQNNFWLSPTPVDIQSVIYDKIDNPAYGEVTFLPVYRERRPPATFPGVSLAATGEAASPDGSPQSSPGAENLFSSIPPMVADTSRLMNEVPLTDTVSTTLQVSSSTSLEFRDGRSGDLVSAGAPLAAAVGPQESEIREPLLEGFLDTRKREYIRKVAPEYPRIYQQTGTQGVVLIEVIVDRRGGIDEYRVLKSDGELFTEAAVNALKRFIYKTGYYQGVPVSFKVVERFQFKLN